jgi:copper chaperone
MWVRVPVPDGVPVAFSAYLPIQTLGETPWEVWDPVWTVFVKGLSPSGRYPVAMTEANYSVAGMSCDHCVRAVETEVGNVPGVASVAVNLKAGRVTVYSDEPVDTDAVRAAVEGAGFEFTA